MKEFLVYTGLRLLFFLAALGVVVGVWGLVSPSSSVNGMYAAVIALVISGIASWFLLGAQREAFAQRVQGRADTASSAFEARKAREDVD